jgi:hypothetical protein
MKKYPITWSVRLEKEWGQLDHEVL